MIADDTSHDIAVLKVSGRNLPALSLADSNGISAGDHVVAIGSPLGLENSVSDGIVSGFREDGKGRSWLQTSAPVSHGNSGGPLLTMDGKVVGVVTWKATEGENLNFAVPSKMIVKLLENSTLQPLGLSAKTEPEAQVPTSERVWTSMMSGNDYKVRIDGDYIYVMRVNLPAALQSTAAFVRSELSKSGDKWTGKSSILGPFSDGHSTKWCHLESQIEIDKVIDSRIEGRALDTISVDLKSCQQDKTEWRSFVWIPK